MTEKNIQVNQSGTSRLRGLSLDESWNQVEKTVSADFQRIITDLTDSSNHAENYNIWKVCTLPKEVHEKIWQDISNVEMLTSVFFFIFGIFVLLSLWHLSLWERRETGLCDIYSFIFMYRGSYMLVALFSLWSYLRCIVTMQGTLFTIWQSLFGYIMIVALDAGAWYYLDNQKSPGSKLRWLLSINLVLALFPVIIGHTIYHARILGKDRYTRTDKECRYDSSNAGVPKLIVLYPLKIFKKPTNRTLVKGLGSAERSLVQTGSAILLITAIWATFIFCNFFHNFYTTLSDSQKELKNALVLGFPVIMWPWGCLMRRVGRVNDALEFKPELNEPKVWERHLSHQAFINARESKRESQQNQISMNDLSFLLTQQKWYHRLPTCILSCFSGSTLEETSNKNLIKHLRKIKDDVSGTSSRLETPLAINQAPEQQKNADGRGSWRETADNPQEVKSTDELNEPLSRGARVEVHDDGKTHESLSDTADNEESSRISSNNESVANILIGSSICHLLKTHEPREWIDTLKDDLIHSGGYDKNIGIKVAQFYFGMFYRTLYYSLFAEIDNMMVIVGFEVINFFGSFVLYFLRMSNMYFRQWTKFTNWLASRGAPFVMDKNEDEWKAELSVRWLLERFTEVLCLADFVISTTVLRYRYPKNDFIPLEDMGGNHEGYIAVQRYIVVMRFVIVIFCFEVFHIVSMLLLFKLFYNLKLRAYLHFLIKSKQFRLIIFINGLHVLQDMYILRHKLELSKF